MVLEQNWYQTSAPGRKAAPALEGSVDADVAIIGGGYTGLSAALELTRRGYRAVLLEAETIGWGASGRNGGQVATAYNPSMAQIARWVGKTDARNLWDMAQEAKHLLHNRVADHAIDCDLKPGTLTGALKQRHIPELRAMLEEWNDDYDYGEARWVERGDIGAIVDCPSYLAGVFDSGAGHIHPLKYARGLAGATEAAGAIIHENSAVTGITHGTRPIVTTERGRVTADHVILAANAYLPRLSRETDRLAGSRIMPVGTFIIATEPLDEDHARTLMGADAAVLDCNFVLNYYRLSADRRMLFGGRVNYSQLPETRLAERLQKTMVSYLPSTADLKVEYCWGGNVAITINRFPHFGRLDSNIFFAHGFSGHGVALTGLAGKLMAEAVAGTAERFDVFARVPHSPFPGGRALRTPALVLATAWYRLRDIL